MEDALDQVQQPGTLLIASGALVGLFYGLFCILGLVSLGMGCMGMGLNAAAAGSEASGAIMFGGWQFALNTIGLLINIAITAAGARVVMGGMALKELRNESLVKQSTILAAAAPIVGIVANLGIAALSLNICGSFCYILPQILITLLGVASAYLAYTVMQEPDVLQHFDS